MPRALEPATAGTAEIHFELDSFELSADRCRIELSKRWFGVRGRRFVRPTLMLVADGVRRRLLADIEHKPWAPEDGLAWVAACPWDGDDDSITELELAVAPDLAVALAPLGSSPQRADVSVHRSVEPRRANPADRSARALAAARQDN